MLAGTRVKPPPLDELILLAQQFLPNRSFPDKGVDVLKPEDYGEYRLTYRTGDMVRAAPFLRRRPTLKMSSRSASRMVRSSSSLARMSCSWMSG